jgi:tetratricopeptide (TPR) repeat protein
MFYTFKETPVFLTLTLLIILSPAISFANADKIFKENNKSVVVVVAYDSQGKPISKGSGFIVRADGAVVTNYHVINNAVDIKVKTGNRVLAVEGLIHGDKENDLVIIKAEGKDLPAVRFGNTVNLNIGEKVYVISSPTGLKTTLSDGILSGILKIADEIKLLEITAPFSEGSSGGPVLNSEGEVIGIVTFLVEEAQDLNFAVPVNLLIDKINKKEFTAIKDSEIVDYSKTADYWFNLGFSYSESGRHSEAIEAYKQSIRIKPDYAKTHYNLGVVYGKSGRHSEAIEAYKQSIRIRPDYADAHYNLGVVYGKSGRHREAIKAYKKAIRIRPDYADAHYNLGNRYRDLGRHSKAIKAYKKAIRIKSDYADAHYNLGVVYGKSGRHREAIKAYKKAIRIKPDNSDAHYDLGIVYGTSRRYNEAIEAFKQAIRIKPDYASAHYNLGLTYLVINDKDSALEEYRILKDLQSTMANKLFNLIYK